MCNNCYHSKGRGKKAWKCPHKTKTHYALGICQNCYQADYTKVSSISQNYFTYLDKKNTVIIKVH